MIKCAGCNKFFKPINSRNIYCGKRDDRAGCSYVNRTKKAKNRRPKPQLIPDYANETYLEPKVPESYKVVTYSHKQNKPIKTTEIKES